MTEKEAEVINQIITRRYGCAVDGRARFRLAWSDKNMVEWRAGTFDIYYGDTDIYLRTHTGIMQVPRYNYALDRWILEALVPCDEIPDLVSVNGKLDYSAIWIFWDTRQIGYDDNYASVEPTLFEIDQKIHFARKKTLKGHRPTEEQIKAMMKARLMEQIDEALPDSTHALVHGSAAFFDSTKQKGLEVGDK